jgi:hypothetical protein
MLLSLSVFYYESLNSPDHVYPGHLANYDTKQAYDDA